MPDGWLFEAARGKLSGWMAPFSGMFTAPTWQRVLVLLIGAVLSPGRRTVAAALRATGLDHGEEAIWREGATIIGFRSDTAGDTDSVEIDIDGLEDCTLEVCGTIGGYKKIGDPRVPTPFVHCPNFSWSTTGAEILAGRRLRKMLAGTEMCLTLERLSNSALPRDVSGRFDLAPVNGPHGFRPVYLRAEGAAADKAMTSPLFVRFENAFD